MRPVVINEEDDALFNANFSPLVAITYQNHIKEIRRMVKQQGNGFWIRFVTSLRSHAEQHRLMDGIAFSRAEAVFVDMLQLLTCGDNLQELTRLVNSLRAMQSAIIANDYQILMDPVLRIMMTHYDKPLDGLRLYFRFVAGLVVMFRRWKQAAWRTKKEGDVLPPWEPPPHWKEITSRDYSEWTFEGNLLCMFGPELPNLLGLPPGLPCWMPDELKNGIIMYPNISIGDENLEQIPQDMNRVRNKRKGRRRKSRQFEEGYNGYEPYSTKATASSGDSGVCLINDQGIEGFSPNAAEMHKNFNTNICGAEGSINTPDENHNVMREEELDNKNSQGSDSTDDSSIIDQKTPVNVQNKEADGSLSNIVSHQLDQCKLEDHNHVKNDLIDTASNEHHFAAAGDGNCEYCAGPEPYTDEERPDYLYILECRGPGIIQNGQYPHPAGMPPMEQNYGPNYDPCLQLYRRDCGSRVMMGPNNFRPMPHMEEMQPMPRPPPWAENQGNFMQPSHMAYYEAPMPDFMGPDMRRRGPQGRRFRQRRMRPPPLGTIEENFDLQHRNEVQILSENLESAHDATTAIPPFLEKKQWRNKKQAGGIDTFKDENENKELSDSKIPITSEVHTIQEVPENDTNKPPIITVPNNTLTGGYALAVCGLLGRSEKTETNKDQRKIEEKPKPEILNTNSIIINNQKSKKPKRKPGRPQDNLPNDKLGRIPSNKDIPRDCDKGRRYVGKQTDNNLTQKCYVKSNTGNRGKFGNYRSPTTEMKKTEKSNLNDEPPFMPRGGKGPKINSDYRMNGSFDGEKPNDKRRKWKSVWTRRRDPESLHPEEKPTAEGDGIKKKEINNNHDSDSRGGIPQNVPDILKQVENSELKGFWKDCNDAPKPQRKFRASRRDAKRINGMPEMSREMDNHNLKDDPVTPVVKLDVLPAVEPKDKEVTKQDISLPEPGQKSSPIKCTSEIGWYEETLAEDKDREKQRQANNADGGGRMSGQRKNKNRKWKRKSRKGRDERNGSNSFMNEESKDEPTRKNNEFNSEDMNILDKRKSNSNDKVNRIKSHRENFAGEMHDKDTSINGFAGRENKLEHINKREHSKKNNEKFQNGGKQKDNKALLHNIEQCKTIIDEVLLKIPDNSARNTPGDILKSLESEMQSKDFSEPEVIVAEVLEGVELKELCDDRKIKNDKEQSTTQEKESSTNSAFESNEKKNKDYEIAVVNRRRQVYLARTLKYLAGLKTHIPLFTKKDLLKFFLCNEEILKIHRGALKRLEIQILPASLRTSSSVLGVPYPPPHSARKKLLFRHCDNCNVLENYLGEYGECVRCKERSNRSPRAYCSRFCQYADWKRRHRAEHDNQDVEDMA